MDKQRNIYRQLIVDLFKENFDSALFVEKCAEMMNDCDFESIRDDIEEDYFTKNRGITPYIKAIKYLCTKIEASTASHTLFVAVEDYICAKKNTVVTKIVKAPEAIEPAKGEKSKYKKRKGGKKENEIKSGNSTVHPECTSPQSCKKCRIMRRLNRSELKPRKLNKKMVKSVASDQSNIEAKTEVSNPTCSDISDSETPINLSKSTVESTQITDRGASKTSQNVPSYQLPYLDHQYSRISFYGSGMTDDSRNHDEKKSIIDKETKSSDNTEQSLSDVYKGNNVAGSLLKPKSVRVVRPTPIIYRFKPNYGLRQPTPAYYVPNSFASTPTPLHTANQTSTLVRTISTANQSIFANATAPVQFRAPVTILQRSMIHYVSFSEPQPLNN